MGALRVYKYPLPFPRRDDFALSLPKGATPLTFAFQGNDPFLWALVDPAAPPVDRPFRIAGTGHPISVEGPWQLQYVGTAHLDPDGPRPLVFHLFERADGIDTVTPSAEPSGAAGGVVVASHSAYPPAAGTAVPAPPPAAPAGVPHAPAGVGHRGGDAAMTARHHIPLGERSPKKRRVAADGAAHDALCERHIRAVIADGSWRSLLPLPIDGLVLVPSRTAEYVDHEVSVLGHRVTHCSGPCGARPTCFHRVSAALASWQSEHPDWDLRAVCDPQTGEPRAAILRALIRSYLEPAAVRGAPWTADLDRAGAPEHRDPAPFARPSTAAGAWY